jgi:putative transport protein
MEFIKSLFASQGTASTILYISLAAFLGILLGKIEIRKVRLGIAGVLFTGLFFTQMGAKFDINVLNFVRDFGLILFVYAIGIDVGPRFFSSFKQEGMKMNILAIGLIVMGLITAYIIYFTTSVSAPTATGIMCGAVFNTPCLGAAQQVIADQGGSAITGADTLSMAFAVTYPFGVLGVLFAMIVLRLVFRINVQKEADEYNAQMKKGSARLESVTIRVTNPNLYGRKMSYIQSVIDKDLVISRILRNHHFLVMGEDDELLEGDIIYGVSAKDRIDNLKLKIGEVEISEKREITGDLGMAHVLVTNRKFTGKTIEQIGIYRRYEANITRIFRSGIEILPTRSTNVELGDTVRVVGKRDLLNDIRQELGNSVNELAIPNTIPVFLGIFLGVIIGSVPLFIPGLSAPAKLGLAGGPLLVAILLGHKGRVGSLNFYMTPGAISMIREIGIILFLASVGLQSGAGFVQNIAAGGYNWMVYGALVTFIPVMTIAVIARLMKFNYLKICGMLAGSMTNPPALEYANSLAPTQAQSTAYATVYPLTMFLRVLLAQIFILTTL